MFYKFNNDENRKLCYFDLGPSYLVKILGKEDEDFQEEKNSFSDFPCIKE